MKAKLSEMYRDYFNNFTSSMGFAWHYNLTHSRALRIIRLGRIIHEKGCAK